jgi:hypothetical protein
MTNTSYIIEVDFSKGCIKSTKTFNRETKELIKGTEESCKYQDFWTALKEWKEIRKTTKATAFRLIKETLSAKTQEAKRQIIKEGASIIIEQPKALEAPATMATMATMETLEASETLETSSAA